MKQDPSQFLRDFYDTLFLFFGLRFVIFDSNPELEMYKPVKLLSIEQNHLIEAKKLNIFK